MNLWNETKSVPVSHTMVWEAYKRVRSNQGSAGVDQISMDEFDADRSKHLYKLWNRMASGSYFPPPVKEVEIPKKDGDFRKLGIPTVLDRFIQQSIQQEMNKIFDPGFSLYSYGFRQGKNCHQAILQALGYVNSGSRYVVDIDLSNFFDRVNHDYLMSLIAKEVKDKELLRLIRRYLQSGIMVGGVTSKRTEGTPQGSPLTPPTQFITFFLLSFSTSLTGIEW